MPNSWHDVHLGSRAVGGASLVFTEATAVVRDGRISPGDTGIWNDAQAEAWARIARLITARGAVAGMQLAHAGRKAGTDAPWRGGGRLAIADGGWQPVAPSAIPVAQGEPAPTALDAAGIREVDRRLPRRRGACRSVPGFASPRSTPRTATCCTSSSRR